MLRILIGLLTTLFTISAMSQEFVEMADVTWSEQVKNGRKQNVEQTFHHNGEVYLIKSGKSITLEKYDERMKLIDTVDLPSGIDRLDFEFISAHGVGESIYIFMNSEIQKDSPKQLAYFRIPCNSIQKASGLQVLYTVDKMPDRDRHYQGKFGIEVSEDESKIAVLNDKWSDLLGFRLYDSDLNPLYESDIQYAIEGYDLYNDGFERKPLRNENYIYQVTNGGDLIIRIRGERENEPTLPGRYREDKPHYFHLLKYSFKDESYSYVTLNLNEARILSLEFDAGHVEGIAVGGFYSENMNQWDDLTCDGAFFFLVDFETMDIKNSSSKPFINDFITSHYVFKGMLGLERSNPPAIGMELRSFEANDEGMRLVGDQYFTYETQYTINHLGKDIVVASADRHGDIEWITKVNKEHEFKLKDKLSVGVVAKTFNNKTHLIYNIPGDHFYSESEQDELSRSIIKTNYTALSVVDSSGNVDYGLLRDNDESGQMLIPGLSDNNIDGNSLLMFTLDGRTQQLGKVTLK